MSLSSDEFKNSKAAFEELKQSMAQGLKIQKDMEKGLVNYTKALKNIYEQQKNINFLEEELKKNVAKVEELKQSIADKEKANSKEIDRWQKLYKKGTKKQKEEAKKHLDILTQETEELKKQLGLEEALLDKNKKYVESQKKNLEQTKQMASEASKLKATLNSMSKMPGFAKKWGFDKMKSWGIFEMDKELRNAARSMNVGAKDFKSFSNGINKAAETTVAWGVNTKDLAKMQQGYSEAIGRSVVLTEEGNKAMALMAEGTGLGSEFAVQMASEMDKFGGSVETAKDLIAGTIKQAGKMGVNGAAASKKLVSLLKLSQTYVFKGGLKALDKMAVDAERLKLDLEGAAGMAEKVMRPEGAVETAALLTTMGGEFAKLGDPFQLMFKARNDFAGFSKDIGKASAEFVEYNEQTKSFEIKGGLARDRMLEISKITGIQMEKLQEMAEAEKKLQMVQANTPAGIVSEEDKALVASLTQIGKNGELMIKMPGKDPLRIEQLNKAMLDEYKKNQDDLETKAEQARTFDEVVTDFIMSLKQTLLPFVQELREGFGQRILDLMKEWRTNGFYQSLKDFAKGAGQIVSAIGKFLIDNPFITLTAWAGLKALTWFNNGIALGKGFNMVAAAGNAAAGGRPNFMSMGGAASGRGGSGFFKDYRSMAAGEGLGGKFRAARYASSMNKWGTGAKLGGTAALGLGAYGLSAARGDENSDFYNSAGGKALGVGSSALSGAATGMMFGPWGALIGGLIGAGIGAYNEFGSKDKAPEPTHYDDALISSNGKHSKGPGTRIQFNPHDKFMSFDDVMIAGTNAGANNKLYEQITGKDSNNNSKTDVSGKINHDIKISVSPDKDFGEVLVNALISNPVKLSELDRALRKQNNSDRGGGKQSAKPKANLSTSK